MNNGVLGYILAFSVGAAAGAVVSWKMLETKYTRLVDAAYAEAKELYANRKRVVKDQDVEEENTDIPETKPTGDSMSVREYAAKLAKSGYVNYSDVQQLEEESEPSSQIYIIPPEEYGENEEYERIELTYYVDGVLADDMNEIIEDVDDVIGVGSLNRFGEYEEDSIHVRNELMKCDYEVLLSTRAYSEIRNRVPHRAEG